jgi:hypothetical protein
MDFSRSQKLALFKNSFLGIKNDYFLELFFGTLKNGLL